MQQLLASRAHCWSAVLLMVSHEPDRPLEKDWVAACNVGQCLERVDPNYLAVVVEVELKLACCMLCLGFVKVEACHQLCEMPSNLMLFGRGNHGEQDLGMPVEHGWLVTGGFLERI